MPRHRPDEDDDTPAQTCTKCGGFSIHGPFYHRHQLECSNRSRYREQIMTEHLHFECICGYDWIGPVLTPTPK